MRWGQVSDNSDKPVPDMRLVELTNKHPLISNLEPFWLLWQSVGGAGRDGYPGAWSSWRCHEICVPGSSRSVIRPEPIGWKQ